MEKADFTIGVDVSRNTLDIYCVESKSHICITNNTAGFRDFSRYCKNYSIDLKQCIVVLEYTGGYEYRFLQFLQAKRIAFVRIPGLAIKRSLGITRGKNDKIDARRIAQFADEKYKTLSPEKPVNEAIQELKSLLTFRKKLVRENAGYKSSISERKHMYDVSDQDIMISIMKKKIRDNERAIEKIESRITQVIASDDDLHRSWLLLKSIRGIGDINAWMTIAYTENFKSFPSARSYAVYVGVIPFEHSSGTSIKGRRRVSQVANKELKQELNQAAKSAIQWDGEIKAYATRKLQTKHYGIVLNNVKFKLILRMFAVVKRGDKYVDNYQKAA